MVSNEENLCVVSVLSTFVKEMDGIDYEMEYKEKDNDFWNMRF